MVIIVPGYYFFDKFWIDKKAKKWYNSLYYTYKVSNRKITAYENRNEGWKNIYRW